MVVHVYYYYCYYVHNVFIGGIFILVDMIIVVTVLLLLGISSSCGKSASPSKMYLYFHFLESRTITAQKSVVDYGSDPHTIHSFVSLVCVIKGPPATTRVRWTFGDVIYENKTGRAEVFLDSGITNTVSITTLFIQNLTYSDGGLYTCDVWDEARSVWINATVQLNLLSKLNVQ